MSLRSLFAGSLLCLGLGVAGCGGNGELDPGLPKDAGFVPPPMVPNMAPASGKRPVMGATDKERKEALSAAAAADAAALKTPAPTPK